MGSESPAGRRGRDLNGVRERERERERERGRERERERERENPKLSFWTGGWPSVIEIDDNVKSPASAFSASRASARGRARARARVRALARH